MQQPWERMKKKCKRNSSAEPQISSKEGKEVLQVPKERFPCSPKTRACQSRLWPWSSWRTNLEQTSTLQAIRNLLLKQLDAPWWKVQPVKSPVRNRFLTELSPVESSLYRTRCSGSCGPWGTHAEEVCLKNCALWKGPCCCSSWRTVSPMGTPGNDCCVGGVLCWSREKEWGGKSGRD